MTKEQKVLLELVSRSLFGFEGKSYMKADLGLVFKEAQQQAVVPLAFSKASLPEGLSKKIGKNISRHIANNIRVEYDHTELHNILSSNNIPYVILKGCASASYYDVPILRCLGDCDFLVYTSDLKRAGKVLLSEGFECSEEKNICHTVYKRGDAHLEMHWEVPGIPGGEIGEAVRNYLSSTIADSVTYQGKMGTMRIPNGFHHGLIILLHTSKHMTGEGIGLRHLCDWAVYANKVDVPEVLGDCLKNIGLYHFAQILTQLSVKYLGLPEQRIKLQKVFGSSAFVSI